MTASTPTPRRAWLAALALVLLVAAGCSDDDGDDTATTRDDVTSSTEDDTDTTDGDTDTTNSDTTTTEGSDGGDGSDSASADDLAAAGAQAQDDLEQALRVAGLTSLATAVNEVDLSEVLTDEEFTVFAPNDDAFLALDSDDVTDLFSSRSALLEVLRNHLVVGERIEADDLAGRDSVTTEAGTSLAVAGDAGSLTVGDATVVDTETVANGVIHVIDTVLFDGAGASN